MKNRSKLVTVLFALFLFMPPVAALFAGRTLDDPNLN
jgi:hypothetical protein